MVFSRTLPLFGSTVHTPAQPPDYDSVVPPPAYSKVAEPVPVAPLKVSDQYVAKPASYSRLWNMPSVETTSSSLQFYEPTAIATTLLHRLYTQQALHGGTQPLELVFNGGAEPSAHEVLSLGDGLSLLPESPHVSVKSTTGKAGLAALLNTSGLTSMWPQANIIIDPSKALRKRQTNSDVQRERWLNEQRLQAIATVFLSKSGMSESKRDKVMKLLKAQEGRKVLNAMQALNEGKNGIISYIKMGNDRGIVRTDLDAYFKQQGWDPKTVDGKKAIKEFIRDADNVDLIPSRPLAELFPQYASHKVMQDQPRPSLAVRRIRKDNAFESKVHSRVLPKQTTIIESMQDRVLPQILTFPGAKKPASLLSNDGILFSTGVSIDSINHLARSLAHLDQKRVAEKSNHHIPVYVTSPGGNVHAGDLFKDTINQLKTPVDVIINNYGASSAVMQLLVGATGKRLATPQSLLLVHEGSIASSDAHEVGDYMKEGEGSMLRFLAKKTGRSLAELRRDTKQDYWLNPLEALFYGKKGLLDGILVHGTGLVTRADVQKYLEQKLGSSQAVDMYLKERFERRRDMGAELDRKFDVNDPFDNFIDTTEKIVARTGHKLGEHPDFLHSGPHPTSDAIEHIQVKERVSLIEIMMQNLPVFSKMLH
jgi:ATP-dependent Clp protease, protease subunit